MTGTAVEKTAAAEVLGVAIAPLTMAGALDAVDAAIAGRRRLRIGVVNAAKLVNMRRDPLLRADVVSSDLVLADGMSVVWASRLLGRGLPERVAGIDLMTGILERGRKLGYRLYLLGATAEVLEEATANICSRFPGIQVVGRQHGYFSAAEEPEIAARISAARPDVLLVAMSSPRKEHFMARWGSELEVTVLHGVGGSFDVLAGRVRRAPALWQRLGLEWLYRVVQEPRRLWRRYLVTNTVFLCQVTKALVVQLGRRRHRSADTARV